MKPTSAKAGVAQSTSSVSYTKGSGKMINRNSKADSYIRTEWCMRVMLRMAKLMARAHSSVATLVGSTLVSGRTTNNMVLARRRRMMAVSIRVTTLKESRRDTEQFSTRTVVFSKAKCRKASLVALALSSHPSQTASNIEDNGKMEKCMVMEYVRGVILLGSDTRVNCIRTRGMGSE